jgi:hypothetical protein
MKVAVAIMFDPPLSVAISIVYSAVAIASLPAL